jgi:ATP-binding cassette, subfamily B, multidrug efflux pump
LKFHNQLLRLRIIIGFMRMDGAGIHVHDEVLVPIRQRWALVWKYLSAYPRLLVPGVACLLGRNSVAFAIPLLIRAGINSLTSPRGSGVGIVEIALAIAGVAALGSALQTAARLNVIGMSRHVEYEMRKDFLKHLFRLDASFWTRTRTGDIMALATNDLNAVRMMLGIGLVSFFESMVQLPVAVAVLAWFNWKLTLAALLPAPAAVLLMVIFGKNIRLRFDRIQALFSTMSAAVQQTIAGARVVRSFVREKAEQDRFEGMNQAYVRSNCILGIYASTFDPLLSFITGTSILIVLWYGGSLVVAHTLRVGDFVMFTTYMAMLAQPISSLGRTVNMMQRGMASVARLQLLFIQSPVIEPGAWLQPGGEHEAVQAAPRGEISLRQVSVFYGNHRALDSVDLNIPAGSTLAILGETGSGKSTLVKLITRTMDPDQGVVLFDGVDGREIPLTSLRSQVGVVPQETFLFSITLAENIALGVEEASDEEIGVAATIAGLDPDLAALPEGIETVVGERGIMLSGGQKQRIAIARAVLKNPRILVLDDALSSVDSVTEARILHHLKSIMAERTTVHVTHRVATAMQADHIVILKHGSVVEQGTHADLIVRNGHYARLARLQVLEGELEVL